jgi:hypothetical protein
MAMETPALTQADQFIEKRLSLKPPCRNKQAKQKFEVVNRVFLQFYIGEIQPMFPE